MSIATERSLVVGLRRSASRIKRQTFRQSLSALVAMLNALVVIIITRNITCIDRQSLHLRICSLSNHPCLISTEQRNHGHAGTINRSPSLIAPDTGLAGISQRGYTLHRPNTSWTEKVHKHRSLSSTLVADGHQVRRKAMRVIDFSASARRHQSPSLDAKLLSYVLARLLSVRASLTS